MKVSDYLSKIPQTVPAGRIVVHNHIVPPSKILGVRGFRAWLASTKDAAGYVKCDCDWAPHLGAHYRVERVAGSA